jgi:hypothetical protein
LQGQSGEVRLTGVLCSLGSLGWIEYPIGIYLALETR